LKSLFIRSIVRALTRSMVRIKNMATSNKQKDYQIDREIPATISMSRGRDKFSLTVNLDQDSIVDAAKQVISRKFKRHSAILDSPDKVKDFLVLQMALEEREVFACLFLDNKNRLISFEKLFFGSINQASINVREIIKRALLCNAACVIGTHNHPSGNSEPSAEDKVMTHLLYRALKISEIRLLDHFIVGGEQVFSMNEHGYFDDFNS